MKPRTQLALLSLLTVIGAALRFHGLATQSLWGDEALGWLMSRMSIPDLIRHVISWEQIPPAHHLLLWLWTKIFGTSEWSLRAPSALADIASIPALFILVRRLLTPREGIIAAALLTFSPLHLSYAHEARTYTLTFLIAILATDAFVRLLQQPTTRTQVAYTLLATLLIYCHLYGVFILAAHQLIFFTAKRPLGLKRWLTICVAIAMLYSPWIRVVVGWVRAVNINFFVKEVTPSDISRAYWTLSGSTSLYILTIIFAACGVANLRRRHREPLILLLALTFLPVLLPVTISILTHPSFAPRYAIVAGVGLYPLVGTGIAAIRWTTLRWFAWVFATVLSLLSINSEAVLIPKSPWRDAVAYVESHAQPDDIAVVHIKAKTRLYDYYARNPQLQRRGFDSVALPVDPKTYRHVWFIRHEEWALLRDQLNRGPWTVVSHKWFGDILVMELKAETPATTQASPPPSPATPPRSPSP